MAAGVATSALPAPVLAIARDVHATESIVCVTWA